MLLYVDYKTVNLCLMKMASSSKTLGVSQRLSHSASSKPIRVIILLERNPFKRRTKTLTISFS